MFTLDLKTLIFTLILLLVAVAGMASWLVRRRARPTASLPGGTSLLAVLDDAPFGMVVLEGDGMRYANPYARRLLHLPDGEGALLDTD